MKEKEEESFVMKEWLNVKIKIRNMPMKTRRIVNYDDNKLQIKNLFYSVKHQNKSQIEILKFI